MFEIHKCILWDAYDKNCWFYKCAKSSYFTLKMAFESCGQNVMWHQCVKSVCVLEILQHLPQNFSINWWNYSIWTHLTFSLPLNFSSIARCKQTRTHKLTSQCNKFGSSLLAIFGGKIAQLCALVKSIFIGGIPKFGFEYFRHFIIKLCRKNFRFIGTLKTLS